MQVRKHVRTQSNSVEKFLKTSVKKDYYSLLDKFGKMGVDALASSTPKKTGKTAASWGYNLIQNSSGFTIEWYNTNVVNGYFNVALIIDSGHASKNGYWIEGYHYIEPTMRPLFDSIAEQAWKEVTAK